MLFGVLAGALESLSKVSEWKLVCQKVFHSCSLRFGETFPASFSGAGDENVSDEDAKFVQAFS